MQNNIIPFPDNHPYPKRLAGHAYGIRCNTAYEDFAVEVILIADHEETRELIKSCLGYQP